MEQVTVILSKSNGREVLCTLKHSVPEFHNDREDPLGGQIFSGHLASEVMAQRPE